MDKKTHDLTRGEKEKIIVIRNLNKYFGELKAVSNVNLEIKRGQVVVIIGPSGSGKSTLLRCINHLEEPTTGDILIDGVKLRHKSKSLNAIRREVGMVFQQFNLFPHLTVLENITIAQKIVRKRSKKDAIEIARQQLIRTCWYS